jgi:polyferredoxin
MSKINQLIAQSVDIGSIEPVTEVRQPESLTNEDVLSTLEIWISDIIGIITVLGTLFFIVYAFIAAFNWITAAGDKSKIEKAKDRLVWSTLGLILMVASYAIIGLIGGIIGLELLQPAAMIEQIIPTGQP